MTSICLAYKLNDTQTGMCYTGLTKIGDVKEGPGTSIPVIKDVIFKHITTKIILTDRLYVKVIIDPTIKQTLPFTPRGKSWELLIDVSENLGLPRYLTNTASFKILSYEAGCYTSSKSLIIS